MKLFQTNGTHCSTKACSIGINLLLTVINLALTLYEGGVAHVKADNGPHHS